jgi:hypothetical protein
MVRGRRGRVDLDADFVGGHNGRELLASARRTAVFSHGRDWVVTAWESPGSLSYGLQGRTIVLLMMRRDRRECRRSVLKEVQCGAMRSK